MAPPVTEVSRHKCLIYDGHPSEQFPVVLPLLQEGLRHNERCLYLGDEHTISLVRDALSARGVDVERAMAKGALVFSSDRGPADEPFDPQAMIGMLVGMIDAAVADGFSGLCATGDMRWELGDDDRNFDRLLEYEALLERVFREKPLRGICQYHRSTVPPKALETALQAHRSLYLGTSLNNDNLFYIPPELLLEDESQRNELGAWMCRQLTRIMDAEKTRDGALQALRASEQEQRRLAEDLAISNHALEARVRERTWALEAANRELEAFAYSVSHDLRAPIRHIDGFTQTLERKFGDVLGADGGAYVQKIRDASGHMNELIDGMLALGQVSRGDLSLRPIDLTALATSVVEGLRRSDPGRRVECHVESGLAALGDVALLRSVLENLLGNAWKFTSKSESARIDVLAEPVSQGFRTFLVRDNGAGFDMAFAKRLFGAFQRLHHQNDFKGTGVGLATVQRIIGRHGGRVWAEAAVGKGATFYFSLPVEPGATDRVS